LDGFIKRNKSKGKKQTMERKKERKKPRIKNNDSGVLAKAKK
jgi:hypothetical protein